MELRIYLRTMITRWWIVLPTFLVTFLAALAFTISQKPVYEATATYVVSLRVSPLDDRMLLSALTTLRAPEISGTFVELASSRLITGQAASELGLSDSEQRNVTVSAQSVVGTNLINISAEAPDPAMARDFASAAGRKTAAYVRGLYGTFELQLVDEPILPTSPVRPRVLLNLLMGGLTGLVLGAGLALLSEYLAAEGAGARPAVDQPGAVPQPVAVPVRRPTSAASAQVDPAEDGSDALLGRVPRQQPASGHLG